MKNLLLKNSCLKNSCLQKGWLRSLLKTVHEAFEHVHCLIQRNNTENKIKTKNNTKNINQKENGRKNVTYSKTLFDGGREVDLSKIKICLCGLFFEKKNCCAVNSLDEKSICILCRPIYIVSIYIYFHINVLYTVLYIRPVYLHKRPMRIKIIFLNIHW